MTWRVGRKVGRTIYAQVGSEPSDDDVLIGVMDTPELAAEVVQLREDYYRLLLAHPDDQYAALVEYLRSNDGGLRTIDAARRKITEATSYWQDRSEVKAWEQAHADKLADELA